MVALKAFRYWAVAARCPKPGAILDVGCGRGDLLAQFQARGWRARGTQVSRTAAEAARLRGLDVVVGELPDLGLAPASFDAITLFHVLEHLPDPAAYLACARGLLAEGGLLVVEVPNFRTWGFALLGRRDLASTTPTTSTSSRPGPWKGSWPGAGSGWRAAPGSPWSILPSPPSRTGSICFPAGPTGSTSP